MTSNTCGGSYNFSHGSYSYNGSVTSNNSTHCEECEQGRAKHLRLRKAAVFTYAVAGIAAAGAVALKLLHNQIPFIAAVSVLGGISGAALITHLYKECVEFDKDEYHEKHITKTIVQARIEARGAQKRAKEAEREKANMKGHASEGVGAAARQFQEAAERKKALAAAAESKKENLTVEGSVNNDPKGSSAV